MQNKTLALLVVFAMALAVVPTTSAGPNDFGDQAAAGDWPLIYGYFAVPSGVTNAPGAFIAYDLDGDGAYDNGEPVILDTVGPGVISANDVWMNDYDGRSAGDKIAAIDNAVGGPVAALGAAVLAFSDQTGDGYSDDDEIFIDVDGSGTVTAGDIDFVSGTSVTAGNADLGATLTAFAAASAWSYVETSDGRGADGYDADDLVFFDLVWAPAIAPTGDVAIGDVYVSSEDFAFGSQADEGDWPLIYGYFAVPSGVTNAAGAFIAYDLDGDGAYDNGEPVILDTVGAGVISANDVWMNDYDGRSAGDKIAAIDNAVGGPVAALGAAVLAFLDQTGDGYSDDDEIFIDVDGSGTVTAGDIDFVQGSSVTASNADLGATLTAYAAGSVWSFVETSDGRAADGYDADDLVFLDTAGGTGDVAIGDVYVSSEDFAFGSQAAAGDWPLIYGYFAVPSGITNAAGAFIAYDLDGDGAYDNGEPVILDAVGAGVISANDVWTVDYDGRSAGDKIAAVDNAVGGPVAALGAAVLAFSDQTGDGYSDDDEIFIDVDGSGTVTAGDIDFVQGSSVTASNADLGATLTAFVAGSVWSYVETSDGRAADGYDADDLVFLDISAGGTGDVAIGDVYASGTAAGPSPTTTTTTTTSPPPTTTTTSPPPTTTTTSPPPTTTGTDTETDTGTGTQQTPGFELVALLAGLGAAFVLVRRRL